ncbi:sugar transferase [Myxococcaceae bacterium GXIMD 01537]
MSGKRLLDLALLLPLLPFFSLGMGVLALAVLIADGRPVFFTQPRLGRGRRVFHILKLRTMTCEPDVKARRPTRLGAMLRQHGVDELPQLFNVLKGDMSLVGPRPLTEEDVERLVQQHAALAERFEVPPGLTGLPQVCQARGAALTAALDAEYARTRSAAVDLRILMRTAWMNVVGKRRGARPLPAHLAPR